MKFAQFITHPGEWLKQEGPYHNVVVSSRVRLARNLRDKPFPGWAKKAERLEIVKKVKTAIESLPEMTDAFSENLESLSPLEKQILVERHLISREHAAKGVGSAIVMNVPQTLSFMINEEDHLRIQALSSGLQLSMVFDLINQADTKLETMLDFAFHDQLGYLTACPTNIGTGMRASAMLHLPGLVMNDLINKIINSVNKIGLAVRGLYGEGSEAIGNLFQISNQTTLGESEKEIIERLNKVIETILDHERNARQMLLERRAITLLDQIGRAYGVLCNAHCMSSKETLNLLSIIKLGIDLELFPESSRQVIDQLFIETQPAHLQKGTQTQKMPTEEKDNLRASIIREKLNSMSPPDTTKINIPPEEAEKSHDE